jgi:hypothetical protein
LIAMFGITEDLEISYEPEGEKRTRKRCRALEESKDREWFERRKSVDDYDESLGHDSDLGQIGSIDPSEKKVSAL